MLCQNLGHHIVLSRKSYVCRVQFQLTMIFFSLFFLFLGNILASQSKNPVIMIVFHIRNYVLKQLNIIEQIMFESSWLEKTYLLYSSNKINLSLVFLRAKTRITVPNISRWLTVDNCPPVYLSVSVSVSIYPYIYIRVLLCM